MRVLGIDPGSRITGYGCIDTAGSAPSLIEAGVFRLGESSVPLPQRLSVLQDDLSDAIRRLSPDLVAVESVFSHTSWPAAALVMAHARGVVLLLAQRAGVELAEIPPAEIKKAVTGSGRASKAQVRAAVEHALSPGAPLSPADVSDALAAALAAPARAAHAARVHSRG